MVEVLLIASESTDTVLLKRYFQSKGASISVVSSYESALEELNSALKPKVILADISIPGMSPYSFLETIKSDEVLCDIPVYYIKSQDSETTDEKKNIYVYYDDAVNFFKF